MPDTRRPGPDRYGSDRSAPSDQPAATDRPPAGSTEPPLTPSAPPPPGPPLDVDELEPTPRKVRRLTAVPILLAGVVVLVVLAAIALLGTRRRPPAQVPNPAEQPAQASSADLLRRRADRLESRSSRPGTGILGPRRLPPRTAPKPERTEPPRPVPVLVPAFHTRPRAPRTAPDDRTIPPPNPPETSVASRPGPRLETPINSPQASPPRPRPAPSDTNSFSTTTSRTSASASSPPAPRAAARAQPADSAAGPTTGPRPASFPNPTANPTTIGSSPGERFLASAEAAESSALRAIRTPPASAFQLAASSRIPAILQTEINSDLPGHVRAVVRRDVYDSTTGTHLLIPRGAVLYGRYNHRVVWGERRVLLAWQRLLFPDGSSLELGGLPAVDGVGAAGLGDLVNNRFVRLYANALLLSAVSAGYQISQEPTRSGDPFGRDASAADVASAAVAQELTRTSNAVLRRNAGIKPTLRIRPGFLFAVEVTRDLAFSAPYVPMAAAGP